MSTTSSPQFERTIDRCRPTDVTPVALDASDLDSTAPEYLRDLKREFTRNDLFPAGLTVDACFAEDCSLDTQAEIDRVRSYVRAGAFLGVGTVTVDCDDVANAEKVRPALEACAERADREGLSFELDAPITLDREA
ncbi:hypothetical protein [Natronosalvus halobius]|uniref:hypothetical protein n=1 Tax=Natronosalvus halobius TaxID=2953746 RepID=UPI0020A0B65B|nr:hypothetical protein [Natronosalvus halobius]USZ72893.1 hypothetical protein NGM15_06200 [Natronosalvus halobius]